MKKHSDTKTKHIIKEVALEFLDVTSTSSYCKAILLNPQNQNYSAKQTRTQWVYNFHSHTKLIDLILFGKSPHCMLSRKTGTYSQTDTV